MTKPLQAVIEDATVIAKYWVDPPQGIENECMETLQCLAKALLNTQKRLEAAMEALQDIYMNTSSCMPAAWNDETSWYQSQLHSCIGRAARSYRNLEALAKEGE